jgi:hypothetical protein
MENITDGEILSSGSKNGACYCYSKAKCNCNQVSKFLLNTP